MRIGGLNGFLPYRATAQLLASSLSPPPSIEEVSALRTPELDRYLPPRRRPSAYQQVGSLGAAAAAGAGLGWMPAAQRSAQKSCRSSSCHAHLPLLRGASPSPTFRLSTWCSAPASS